MERKWILIMSVRTKAFKDEPKFGDNAMKVSSTPYFGEVGSTGLNRYGGHVYEEFLPKLRFPKAAKIYQEMSENDSTIGAIFYMTKQMVRKSEWSVAPATDSEVDIANAKFVEECMHDMSQSWADTISEVLSFMTYGWSLHEIIYKIRRGPLEKDGKYRSRYTDGKIGWRKLPGRSQHTLHKWEFAQDGDPIAMIQQAPPMFKDVRIPFSKALLFRTEATRNNPEGKSLLRNAYRAWYFKKRIEEIEGIGLERDLAGLPILIPPEDVDIWDRENPDAVAMLGNAESIVRNIRRDQQEGVVIPFGWELKLLSTGGSRQFDTNTIVSRWDQRIAITMLSDIVMIGSDNTGSFALADVKKSLMAGAIEAHIKGIADVFNSYAVPSLMEINNMNCKNGYPKLVPEEIESPSIDQVAGLLKSAGVNIKDDLDMYNYVRKILAVKPIDEKQFDKMKEESVKLMNDSFYGGQTPEDNRKKDGMQPEQAKKPATNKDDEK